MAKTNTAIAVSSVIKEVIQKQALATRLTQKEVVYLGMLAIDALDKESRQELADKVHQMQVNGEIWTKRKTRWVSRNRVFYENTSLQQTN